MNPAAFWTADVAEVFAGFVCGYVLALISTPLLALTLLRLRRGGELLARVFPAGVSLASLSVLLHGALFLFWTAVGLLLGLVLMAMGDAGGALGSPNAAFSLFVAGLTVALLAPVAIVVRSTRPAAAGFAVAVLLVFGWLMPYMAGWSRFE